MFTIEMTVARPTTEVFAQLARVEDAPLWYSAVRSVDRLDAGPVVVGARFRYTRELGGKTVVNEVEVSALEPNRTVELTSISGPTPFVYRYRLEPSADGTLLRLEGSISGEGLGGPLALLKPLAETFFRRGMIANLETLKRLIERDPP